MGRGIRWRWTESPGGGRLGGLIGLCDARRTVGHGGDGPVDVVSGRDASVGVGAGVAGLEVIDAGLGVDRGRVELRGAEELLDEANRPGDPTSKRIKGRCSILLTVPIWQKIFGPLFVHC